MTYADPMAIDGNPVEKVDDLLSAAKSNKTSVIAFGGDGKARLSGFFCYKPLKK